jgi:CII-binding regulator of phage lambda lysogenization HflD
MAAAEELDRLWRRVQTVEDQLCDDDETLGKTGERLSVLEQQVKQLESLVHTRLTNITRELADVPGVTADEVDEAVATKLDALKQAINDDLRLVISEFDAQVKSLDSQIAALQSAVVVLQSRIGEEMDNADAMQSSLSDVHANMNTQIRDMQESVRQQFQEQLQQVFDGMQAKLEQSTRLLQTQLEQIVATTQVSLDQKIAQVSGMVSQMNKELAKFTSFRRTVFGHNV